jgi:hypothetical protein
MAPPVWLLVYCYEVKAWIGVVALSTSVSMS